MNGFLCALFGLICGAFVIGAVANPRRVYRFPFLFCGAGLVFVFPSAVISLNSEWLISDSSYRLAITNALLCLIAGLGGYHCFKTPKTAWHRKWSYPADRLFFYNVPALVVGIAASVYLFQVAPVEGLWEGLPVYVLFVARILRPALLVALFGTIKRPAVWKWVLIAICVFFPAYAVVQHLRRSDVFFLAVIIAFSVYFVRGWIVPRIAIVPAICAAFLVTTLFPLYRATSSVSADPLNPVNPAEEVRGYLAGFRSNEFIESAFSMDAVREKGTYGWGATFVNQFIQQYVPRGLVGEDVKKALMFKSVDVEAAREEHSDVAFKFYLAPTGFAQAFFEFGRLGCLVFFALGAFSRWLGARAESRTDEFWTMLYCYFAIFIPFSVYGTLNEIPTLLLPALLVIFWAARMAREPQKQSDTSSDTSITRLPARRSRHRRRFSRGRRVGKSLA